MNDAPLRKEVRIEAPLDVVQRFFTDPARLVQWWPTRAIVDPRAGGRLRLEFAGPERTDVARGEFVELTEARIVFTWGLEGDPDLPPGTSRVLITLEPDGTGTRVLLEHHGLPMSRREAHDHGWTFFLGRLAEVALQEPRPS